MDANRINRRLNGINLWISILSDDPDSAAAVWDLYREYAVLCEELEALKALAEPRDEPRDEPQDECLDDERPLRLSTRRGPLPPFEWETLRPCRHSVRVASGRRGRGGDGDRTQWERMRSLKRRRQRQHKKNA